METPKNTKASSAENSSSKENSSKKSFESKETKVEAAAGTEESKEKLKDESNDQTSLAEGFCGFDEKDNPVQARSTREASRNATVNLTKKSSAKSEKTEGKNDSPPDLVLFLKEGRGRAQSYSEPPRLDPESIATRRRTRVPEDPVALISKAKSASAEKTKKDQKGLIKKERKTKVMDTPESLKRLAREGSRQVQTTSKESSDSGSEEKALKKVYSKKNSEGDVKVKSAGTSTRSEEEQAASISRKNSRGKRNSADKPEAEVVAENRATSPAKDSPDELINYSNLGSILNKMSRNVADKRIPVVIMSKSEKETKTDSAKPKSKKRAPPDTALSTAVLKMASPIIPPFLDDEETISGSEGECSTPKPEDERCGSPSSTGTISDSETDENVIVLKKNSDVRSEEENRTSNATKTGSSPSSDPDSSSREKVDVKQNIISDNKEQANTDNESSQTPGTKETAISEPCESGALDAVQVSSSYIKLSSAASSVWPGTVTMPIRSGQTFKPIRPSLLLPKPVTSLIKPNLVTSLSELNTDTSPISLSQLVSQVTSSQSTSLSKTSSIAPYAKSSPITPLIRSVSVVPEVKTTSGTPPIKPSLVASHAKPSPSTSLVNPISVVSEVKSSSVPLPIKPRALPSQVTPTPSTSQVKPNLGVSHSKPSPVTSQIKSSSFMSHHTHVKPTLSTSPIQSNPFMSQVKSNPSSSPVWSNLIMSQVRPGLVSSPLKSSSLFSRVKPSPVASPIKSTLVVSQVKPSPVSSPLKSTPIASIKSSSIISPIKSGSGTSSCLPGQNVPSFVGSKPKGSMKMTNLASSKMGVKASSNMKATSTTQTPKREITAKQDSYKCSQVSASEASGSLSSKDPILDYTDIETEEVVLGENEDSSGQIDKVGDMPAGIDLLAHEELESSSEEDAVKIPDQPVVPKKESLSPEGRVALDHSYSSGGSGSSRKKSPTTYEKSLTPRPVYSNASPAKRSLDIMLHNDKINILRQMSQIFNDEKPPLEIFSDEKDTQPDTDNSMSSSDGDEETSTVIRQTEENTTTMSSTKTTNNISADPDNKDVKMKKITKSSTMIQEDGNSSEAMSSKPLAVEQVPKPSGAFGTSSEVSSSENVSSNQEKTTEVQKTPPQKDQNGKNILQDAGNIITDSPFLGFPDPDPKVHHVPAYSPSLNEKISVQSKVGPSGEVIDIVDGFSFMSFSSENEMMSYDGTYSGKTMKTRHWLKRKRRRRKRLIRLKGRRMYPKVLREEPGPSVAGSAASPRERGATAECGAFASDDLDRFLVKNSHLNISYPIPKCKVTEDGVTKIDEEVLEPTPTPQTPTRPMSPHSPYAPDSSPGSPSSPRAEVTPSSTQSVTPVNPNSSAVEHTGAEAVPQYEEVNAIDILYPKEKYKYYYNKELCKETKADGSNVFVQRAGKLVPLTTIFKSQKSPSSEQPGTTNKQSVELVYVYDGGKLLTLGGSLTKINPSNSDCVRARVVLPMGVPPITKGETVAARAKKVQAVEINEDLAKFALSALQSSHLKLEQTADTKGDSEELPPLPGPSSDKGNEEEMDVDTPPVVPVDKVEETDAPKIVPSPLPIKPTKRNILDIIAAKLAMSDDESDGKEDVEEKDAFGDVKESDKGIDVDISQITKHVVAGGKEEGKTVKKEEDDEANIDQGSIVTSVEGKIPLLKQEDLKEEKPNEEVATKPEVSVQKEDMKTETGVEDDVTQTTKDTQRTSARREKEEEDGNEIVYVEKIREVIDLENSENNYPESDTNLEEKHKKDGESKPITKKEENVKSNLMNLKENHNKNDGPQEQKNLNTSEAGDNKEPAVREEENINSVKKQSVNLDRKEIGESKAAVVEKKENSALIERETVTETKASAAVDEENTGNPSSETYNDEALESLPSSGNTSRAESVINEAPRSSLLMSSQESGDKTDMEEKAEGSLESGGQEAFRMDIKSKVFKKNMYRFPSLSREMKRLNMNFVNYEPPPQEVASEEKEEVVQEVKGDCSNEHCKLGCVCDSLLCQRKSVEHCGRIECMFECTCRDESWKLPSGSGRTMNAVSIFNLDREQKEGLALREKDFKRTVIQTGSEVILVGAERKKREIRLPGRYRGTTVWEASEFPENINYFMPPDHPLQPDYPGIPLSEASKYIKKFRLNIPWFDIKGISIWCMDHNCYDCRCLTDPTFNDPIQVESPKKITTPKAKPESSPGKGDESFTSTLSALVDFDEALKHKISDAPSSTNDLELKVPFVADANCSIMNIIVNNSETRRKYTWKLKEWYHHTGYFSARTAGYSKNKTTEETKNMTLSGLAAKETTPEQIVESVVRSLRQQKANDELKLPSLPCDNNFEPFMGDSLINLQNAIGFDPENMKKPSETETVCLKKHLTSDSEDTPISRLEAELKSNIRCRPPKDLKGVIKRRGSGLAEPPLKKKRISKFEDGLRIVQAGSTTLPFPKENYPANPTEYLSCSEIRVPKKTLSLLEMMVDEEKRGELELDLSSNIPGNALLVAEARFRKLINMNIIGVVGINKAGRCIIGTVDSDGTLQVMHQIQNMIRNNTLDVGPNMREIFFPPPYNGIRPRFVMIRCDSHRKWEIVGVVQKKGPLRAPSRASEVKAKATPSTKPQVIDLEEEERQKQLAGQLCDIKQEINFDIIEPPSPDEKDGGDWEGSLPMIASVHSASDFNMAELIGSPETTEEEPRESHLEEEESQVTKLKTPPTQKALPDLVPISSTSLPIPSLREEEDGLSLETQMTNSENSSQQKLYFVPTAFSVPSSTLTTVSSVNTDMPMKSMTLNLASNKVFGDNIEKLPPTNLEKLPPPNVENLPPPTIEKIPLPKLEKLPLPKIQKLSLPKMEKLPLPTSSLGSKKLSYILPNISGLGKIDTIAPPCTQETSKNVAGEHDTDTGQTVGAPASSSSKMLYIPVTSSCVSKVLFVPSVSSGSSQRMMLLPTLSGTNPLDTSSSTTSIPPINSTATVTTSKMKMVLVPSPQDSSKMLLIPAAKDSGDGAAAAGTSSIGNTLNEGDKKKMLVLTPSVINNLVSKASSSDTLATEPYQTTCSGTLFVPLHNTGIHPTNFKLSETGKDSRQESSSSQDNSDEIVVLTPTTNSLPITGKMMTSESTAVEEESPSLFSLAPVASSSGVAETNVVSSLTTISSTMPENASPTNDGINPKATSQDKQHVHADSLNTLLNSTHEEMVTGSEPIEEGLAIESLKDTECEKSKDKPPVTKLIIHSQNPDAKKKEDTLDQEKKQILIKKGGFHWSAVDLSINFKSVKLEWLLGTIRKNVLMNIYRMSKTTHSPVTLSVKNGTSTSMLYGFARYGTTSTLPILILGSVVSAVLSSSSVPDSMLFQINSIKYFIRESTGELSSYTYSSETHLVKLASKKRGNGGEMVGVGEQIEIYKLRDPAYQTQIEKYDIEIGKASGSFSSPPGSCSCTEAGHLMCKGYCASGSSSKWGREVTSRQDSIKGSSSRVTSEDESQYASLGPRDTSLGHILPKEEYRFQGNPGLPTLKELPPENQRHIWNKSRNMSKMMKRKAGGKKARLESHAQAFNVDYNQPNLEEEKSIIPKVECVSEEEVGDIDVLGDLEDSPSILSDLWEQLECETSKKVNPNVAVQKRLSSIASSGESSKRKGIKVQLGGSPMKKMKTGASSSRVEQPCPRSRKPSVLGKVRKSGMINIMASSLEEGQGKDNVDPSSKCPTHLQPSVAGDISFANEEEDSDTIILSKERIAIHKAKRSMLYAAITRSRQAEERNSEVHNKLERMRRKVMRHLFVHLEKIVVKIPGNALQTRSVSHAKKTVLCSGQRVCEILKNEELRLTMEEERVRNERSALIKKLAAIIGDSTEEIKLKWRKWVRENMQNPTAKQAFELTWQPFCLEKDILNNALEGHFDMDYDGGSPLPTGSPLLGSTSSQSSGDNRIIARKIKRPPGRRKRVLRKRGKKLGRPFKIQPNQGPGGIEDTSTIPTSILLMAGTSSRGRKIVRKEDMNFVT